MYCTECGKEIKGKHYELDESPPRHVFCSRNHAVDYLLEVNGIKVVE